MSTPAIDSALFKPPQFPTRQVLSWMAVLLAIAVVPFLNWPILANRILASNFLPHLYCYLGKPGLVWTHVIADSLIGLSYVMISGTLAYLAQKGRRDIPFHWMFLAFGSFIVACGGTHFMEVVTVWVPVYVLSASLKVVTALVSVATAVLLPFTVPRVLSLVQTAKASEGAEAKFHQIADNIQEIFWMVDAITKRAIYVNPAFEQITGRTRASLQEAPLSYHEIIHPDDRARVLSRLDEASRTGKFDEEFRITRPDGTIRWVGTRGFPIRDAQGNIYRLAGVVQDITERKRADEALRESEERFRLAAEAGKMFAYEWDAATDVVVRSAESAQILGIDEATRLTGQRILTKVHPDDREKLSAAVAELSPEKPHLQISYRMLRPDGSVIWVDRRSRAHFNEHGRMLRIVGMVTDITERKRAEESLQLFRMLIDQSNDAIEVIDPEALRFIDINGRACLDLGYTRDELLSMSVYDIVPNVDESMYARVRNELRISGSTILESLHRRKDGSMFPVEISIQQVHLDRIYLVSVARDITERKQAEQALQESQAALARVTRIAAMGELTASIAHEINQPLAAVATNASATLHWLAVQPPNLNEAREAVRRAIQETSRASGVIKRIRALLQKEQPQLRPLDGNEVIREVVLLAENELLRGGVTVRTKLAADVPTVSGDRVQLQQVILNLIMNGIDAMSTIADRPRDLLIQSSVDPEGVLIQVQDSGRGLDLEQAGRIFEPFFTTKPQGIGMGLSISRSIVEAHGGRLWAAPGSPYGAVFQLILPKADSSA
ncbi:MAG TPA: PAS domain S-box protein [Terriglobales bacterium]|nr:PAS domain S-box protein [Terriglobales bacterium]